MSGWWTVSAPDQQNRDVLADALENHEYVVAVERGIDHVWALVKDPGGHDPPLRDVLRDTTHHWGTPRVAWGHANDTGMHGDVEIYGATTDGGISRTAEYSEVEGGWQGRKAEAWALFHHNIDAKIDWWHHFD